MTTRRVRWTVAGAILIIELGALLPRSAPPGCPKPMSAAAEKVCAVIPDRDRTGGHRAP